MGRELELLEALQTNVHGVRKDVAELRGDVKGLLGDVKGLKGDVAGLHNDVKGMQGDVAGLHNDVTGLQGENVSIKQQLQGLRDEVREGFRSVDHRLAETNQNLTNFRREVNHKLKGMGELVINIDKHVAGHDQRILALEKKQMKDQGSST